LHGNPKKELNKIQNMVYVFCAYRDWALDLYKELKKTYKKMIIIDNPKTLTFSYINKINPEYIFFPDWSWMIPSEIVNNFQCVCFHESNLPKFRGGSPIQNQIVRGIKKTKSTALLMNDKLDAGDIILQKELLLSGTVNEIFERMKRNDFEMIKKIIQGKYKQKKQTGKSSIYKRRKPEQSELKTLNYSNKFLYDFIRMLGEPYPNAFIKINDKKMIFKSAKYDGKKIFFEGVIE
jgi:methionyl-tRNA formyltransferase|tara:strand:- start:16084 stop:16788 length:705 start_codon:yes stop_codon:yes gene_type:complete